MNTAEQVVDLIRSQNWKNGGVHSVDRLDAIILVEHYGRAMAADAAVKATAEAWDKAIASLGAPA